MRSILLVPQNRAVDPEYLMVEGKYLTDTDDGKIEALANKIFSIESDSTMVAICAIDFERQISTIMEFEREINITRTDY